MNHGTTEMAAPTRPGVSLVMAAVFTLGWFALAIPAAAQHGGGDMSDRMERSQHADSMMARMGGMHSGDSHSGHSDTALREPGSDAFATIQEVVAELNARGDETDWSQVDLEALRQHLVDMERFILEAEVVEQADIDGGVRIAVRGPDADVHESLRRSLTAHAPMLEQETGWSVSVTDGNGLWILEATSDEPGEVERIRGLGYVGLMVTGGHHQEHHWMIATGQQPHAN